MKLTVNCETRELSVVIEAAIFSTLTMPRLPFTLVALYVSLISMWLTIFRSAVTPSSFSGSISQYKLSPSVSPSPSVSIPPTALLGASGSLADRFRNSDGVEQLSHNAGPPKLDGAVGFEPFTIAVRNVSTRNLDCAKAAIARSARSEAASGCAAMSAMAAKCSGGSRFKSQMIRSISPTDCWICSPWRRSDSSGVTTSDASWTVWAATLISEGWINWHGWVVEMAFGSSSGSCGSSSFSLDGAAGSSLDGAGGSSGGESRRFSGVSSNAGGGGGGGTAGKGFCWTFFKWFAFSAASVIFRIQLEVEKFKKAVRWRPTNSNLHLALLLAWRCHLQHVRVLFVNEEERAVVDGAEPHQQIANLRNGIDRRVVTMRSRVRVLLQPILVVLLLQQHNHVVEEKHTQLDRSLLDGQQPVVDELVVGQVEVLEFDRRFLLVRRLIELSLDRTEPEKFENCGGWNGTNGAQLTLQLSAPPGWRNRESPSKRPTRVWSHQRQFLHCTCAIAQAAADTLLISAAPPAASPSAVADGRLCVTRLWSARAEGSRLSYDAPSAPPGRSVGEHRTARRVPSASLQMDRRTETGFD